MLVLLEVLGQISDTLAQQSNLDLRRAGVTFMGRVLSDDFLLFLSRQCHGILLILLRAKYAKGQLYRSTSHHESDQRQQAAKHHNKQSNRLNHKKR